MARPGLTRHRKFLRLSRLIGGKAVALGSLGLIWEAAYEAGDDLIGSADDVEQLAEWMGKPGLLAHALVDCGLLDESDDGLRVHDLWHHAPDYVASRRRREAEREIKKSCKNCGATYHSPDPRSLYCCDACKVAAFRAAKASVLLPTVTETSVTETDVTVTVTDCNRSPAPAPAPVLEAKTTTPPTPLRAEGGSSGRIRNLSDQELDALLLATRKALQASPDNSAAQKQLGQAQAEWRLRQARSASQGAP